MFRKIIKYNKRIIYFSRIKYIILYIFMLLTEFEIKKVGIKVEK